jgi:hypothetical protein
MVHESLKNKREFNNNKFYMWRCVTTLWRMLMALSQDEVEYLTDMFSRMRDKGS